MQLDPITFALEILNFLVLLWLLKRFLYAPVRKAVAERQRKLNQVLEEAAEKERRAKALLEQHEADIRLWQAEKAKREADAVKALNAERDRVLAAIRQDAANEKAKLAAQRAEEEQAVRRTLEAQARQEALRFASRLLSRVSTPALAPAFVDVLIEDLAQAPQELLERLRDAVRSAHGAVLVSTAHPLASEASQRLQSKLQDLMQTPITCRFEVRPELVGGLRVELGAEVLDANIESELAFLRGLGSPAAV